MNAILEDTSRTRNHFKSRLRYHIIFSTKFRKKILTAIEQEVYDAFRLSIDKDKFDILNMKIDKDHIHLYIEAKPVISPGDIIHRLKQVTTYYLYKWKYDYLRTYYCGKKKHIWTHGYYIASIGLVSEATVWNYIDNQGNDKKNPICIQP